MSDELLPYYNRELSFLRRMGAEFAEAYPKIAGRLRLGPGQSEDPHVERFIEACSYLNARTRKKLDDDFPELTDAMLGVLYPHYQAPVPSMAVVQFALERGQADLVGGHTIAANSALETEPIDGEPCRFRTCYPATVWPIELTQAVLRGRPFTAPQIPYAEGASAVLRIQLRTFSKEVTFAKLKIDAMRFFLQGQSQHTHALYELLFRNTVAVALAGGESDPEAVELPADVIRPVGFGRNEGMLPYPNRSFLGYRLLSEYFTFPEKFLFFDLSGFSPERLARMGNTLEIFIYLDRAPADLEQNVDTDTLRLGCTPIVNLFRQRAEPVTLTGTQTEYRVVPDARRPQAVEVYSVDRVSATSPEGEEVEYAPFYGFKHAGDVRRQKGFWYATRRPAGRVGGEVDPGTEVYLTLVDLDRQPAATADTTLDVETTCLNRDLPRRLPADEGRPGLRLLKGEPIGAIRCLSGGFTATRRPRRGHGAMWRLVSHLALGHASLVDYEEGADALREILKLYDTTDSDETQSIIDGVRSVRSRRVVGRTPDMGREGFCRGVEVTVDFDEDAFTGSGVYLFACVLERFLGLYCSINSFSKLVATTNRREGALNRWPARAGELVLL